MTAWLLACKGGCTCGTGAQGSPEGCCVREASEAGCHLIDMRGACQLCEPHHLALTQTRQQPLWSAKLARPSGEVAVSH